MKLKGRVGAFSYYTSTGGRQIARVAQNASNYGESASRTELQQTRRVKWANLVNFYKANRDIFARAFETKKPNQSDYNKFMQNNIPIGEVALTKKEAQSGAIVLDYFNMSEGSLHPISDRIDNNIVLSYLELPGVTDISDLTIGEFSTKIIDANPQLREGDQISYVTYQQLMDSFEIPYYTRILIEVTLYRDSTESMARVDPNDTLRVSNGVLAGPHGGKTFGACFFLSRLSGSQLQVSTEYLMLNNENWINEYSNKNAIQRAIDSYGLTKTAFLTPGSAIEPKPSPAPQMTKISITSVPQLNDFMNYIINGDISDYANPIIVKPGTEVEAEINDINNYTFIGWSDGDTKKKRTIDTNQDTTLIAFFSGPHEASKK